MNIRLFAICILSLTVIASSSNFAQESTELTTIKLWPDGLPADAKPLKQERIDELKAKNTDDRVFYVDSPMLTVYEPAAEKKNGTAVVVCPGGGYNILAYKHEGVDLAKWFNEQGVTAFLLKYRVPRRQEQIHWEPMQDVQRAVRVVRSKASEYEIDPERIGVLGFSAGGHLTVMAGTQYETKSYEPIDEADKLSCRPNFICPIYAAYLGNNYKDDVVELGDLVNVTKKTPPTFMAVTADDAMRGAQAALLFAELQKSGVKSELHVWQDGGHGYGLYKRGRQPDGWEGHLKTWLKFNAWLSD